MPWTKTKARDLKANDIVIRNVEEGFEWVPGPYGAFIVKSMRWAGDEVTFTCTKVWDASANVVLVYDGDEEVTVKVIPH
jgi:hypothetical protein